MSSPVPPVRAASLPSSAGRGWYRRLEPRLGQHAEIVAAALVGGGFCWRLWLAHATFFNTDEAWHYSVANQSSLVEAYRASLSLAHPPLMIFVLYFWKHLGASDVMIRLPGVIAGSVFCWVFYTWLAFLFGRTVAWCGLVFAAFLPPMIVLSAELRQYSWLLLFSCLALYFVERSLAEDSAHLMWLSSLSLWLAMLSHFSALLVAASLGVYAILRIISERHRAHVIAAWVIGQAVGVALAAFLYRTHISNLAAIYPGNPLRRFGDFYLSDVYFHPGKESLLHFLYRGTFGVFRFICAQRTAGHLTTILFLAGIFLLWRQKNDATGRLARARWAALLLVLPFMLNWMAVVAGLYPYGRTRQCAFLAIFGIAGISVTLATLTRNRSTLAVVLAGVIIATCHLFGTPHSLDMLAVAEQRHEHMERAIEFIRKEVSPGDVLFTDMPTSFQLLHYLCGPTPVAVETSESGFDSFGCSGIRVISTALADGSLTPQTFPLKLRQMEQSFTVTPSTTIWVVQGAWSSGLGEALSLQSEPFAGIDPSVFDRYLEVFRLPPLKAAP